MQRYRNLEGYSGVVAYQIGDDSIRVRFINGETYEYTAAATGRAHIANMRFLAEAGRGLATYVSRFVQDRYARKLD